MDSLNKNQKELWAKCLLTLEHRINKNSFANWLRPTRLAVFDKENFVIIVPSVVSANWLESHYLKIIQEVVFEETQRFPAITFEVNREDGPRLDAVHLSASEEYKHSEQTLLPLQTDSINHKQILPKSLNSIYTFDSFVIGEGNQFAHAAAHAVAKSPSNTQFNPLFIFGGVGLGKTHLLHAIGNFVCSQKQGENVVCVPSEKFMSDFIDSLKNKSTAEFRRLYRSADMLLIDDIQFLFMRGEHTQIEFFHTFNELHQSGKQIVVTCDSPPEKLAGLEERLLSRFQWGLITPIEPPDLETRIAILRQKAKVNGITLPHEVASFLGSYISSNIRDLEGALIHLLAHCSVQNIELSIEAAKIVVKERRAGDTPELTIASIQKHVANHFDVPFDILISRSRKQDVTQARHVAIYLIKQLTKFPLKVIGFKFGNRDHSTIVHAINTVEKKQSLDNSFKLSIEKLLQEISNRHNRPYRP